MKKPIVILVGLFVLLCAIVAVAGNFMLNVAVHPAAQTRYELDSCYAAVYRKYPEMKEWHDTLVAKGNWHDTLLLDAENGLHHAIYLQHDSMPTGSTVILHGYNDNTVRMMRYTYLNYEVLGRNVIVPDHFYHGETEGDHVRFGWLDRLDVTHLWIPLAHALWPEQPMIVHGLSMGGAMTMYTSGEEIADSLNLIGFIEDCGYSSITDQLAFQLKEEYGLPSWPILNAASAICKMKYGWSFSDGETAKQLAKCQRPMLFIHGDSDTYVPTWMVYKNYEAKTQGYKEIWLAPGADHARSIHDNWEDYVEHCRNFIDKIQSCD